MRLREEIRSQMPFLFDATAREDIEQVEKADVDLLPYLEDVCKESLRYIPSIPMTVRKTIERDMLGGYSIPAGTTIYLMANCINRLPTYWGDTANVFDPSRWKSLPETYTTNAFMTFLQGMSLSSNLLQYSITLTICRTQRLCRPQICRG